MLSEPLSVTVGSDVISMSRINQDNYSAVYYGVSTDGLRRYTAQVRHTLPTANSKTESHLARLDCEVVDTDGAVLGTRSVWVVPKVSGFAQIESDMVNLYTGLTTLLEASTNAVLKGILGRQS